MDSSVTPSILRQEVVRGDLNRQVLCYCRVCWKRRTRNWRTQQWAIVEDSSTSCPQQST